MGLFGKIFKHDDQTTDKKTAKIPWKSLTTTEDLEQLEKTSETKLVAIFKHSTRCGISRMALRGFEKEYDYSPDQVQIYFLDLLNHRELSQEIASRFEVAHESPQLILIRSGKIVHHASHSGINARDLGQFLSKAQ